MSTESLTVLLRSLRLPGFINWYEQFIGEILSRRTVASGVDMGTRSR